MLAALMIIDQFGTICENASKNCTEKNFLNIEHEHKKNYEEILVT